MDREHNHDRPLQTEPRSDQRPAEGGANAAANPMRGQLRGMTFAEGERHLAPGGGSLQMKRKNPPAGPGPEKGDEVSEKEHEKEETEALVDVNGKSDGKDDLGEDKTPRDGPGVVGEKDDEKGKDKAETEQGAKDSVDALKTDKVSEVLEDTTKNPEDSNTVTKETDGAGKNDGAETQGQNDGAADHAKDDSTKDDTSLESKTSEGGDKGPEDGHSETETDEGVVENGLGKGDAKVAEVKVSADPKLGAQESGPKGTKKEGGGGDLKGEGGNVEATVIEETSNETETEGPNTENLEEKKAEGGGNHFVSKMMPSISVTKPESLGLHNVQSTLGIDQGTGGMFFVGTPNVIDEEENAEHEAIELPHSNVQDVANKQADESNLLIDGFTSTGQERIARVEADKSQIAPRVDAEVAQALAAIRSSADAARASIEGGFSAAAGQISASAAATVAQADATSALTLAAIDAALASAKATIEADNLAAKTRLGTMRTDFGTAIGAVFQKGASDMTAAGTTWGAKATQTAGARASDYASRPLPKRGSVATFFEGEDYEKNKRQARVDATNQVGTAYRDEYAKRAGDAAGGLGGAMPQVIEGANVHINQVDSALGSNQTNTLAGLERAAAGARDAAKLLAASIRDQAVAQEKSQLAALAQTKTASLASIDEQATQATGSVTASGETLKTSLEAGYAQLGNTLCEMLEDTKVAAGAEAPDPAVLGPALDDASAAMDEAETATRAALTAQIDAGLAMVRDIGTQTATNLAQAATAATGQAQQVAAAFQSAMSGLQATLNQKMSEQTSGFQTAANEAVTGHKTQCDTALSNLEGELNNAKQNVATNIQGHVTTLEGDFAQMHASLGSKITEEANKAADKVQPAWKRIVTFIIKVIIAIAVAVAIAALCASGVGIGLVLLGGALIGAAGAMASYLVDCAAGQAEFSWGQLGVEALKGGIGGLITAATGGIASGATGSLLNQGVAGFMTSGITNTAVQFAAKVGINTGLNIFTSGVQQVVNNVFDKKVPWSQVFTAGQYDAFVGNLGPNLLGGLAGSYNFAPAGGATGFIPALQAGLKDMVPVTAGAAIATGMTIGAAGTGGAIVEAGKGSYGTPDAKAQTAQGAGVAQGVRAGLPTRDTSAGIGFDPRRR